MATATTEPSDSDYIFETLKHLFDEAAQALVQYLKQDVADLESGVTKNYADQDELSAALNQFKIQRGQRKQDVKRLLDNAERKTIEMDEQSSGSMTRQYMTVCWTISSAMGKAEHYLAKGWKLVVDGWGRSVSGDLNPDEHTVDIVKLCAQDVMAISDSVQRDVDCMCILVSEG